MDDVPSSLIALFIMLLGLSAFFSSAETAFSSVNKIRLRNYEEEGRRGAKKAVEIAENFDKTLSTLLVGNNLVNIAAATLSSQIAIQWFGPSLGVFISTFVVTILVLIFGEIIPKSLAKEYAEAYALKTSGILFLMIQVFYPVTWVFLKIKKLVTLFVRNKETTPSVTEEEIKMLVQISEDEGVIGKKEREMVHRSLEFDDIIVHEILKPRPDMVAVEVNQPISEIKDAFLTEHFSRIPVYEGNIDNVIGILSERDFLTAYIEHGDSLDLTSLIRRPMYVVESMKISTLLPELQKQKVHMAIVIDEFGGTSGLVTLEDVLEEIVGEIWDEHDVSVNQVKQVGPSSYVVDADYSIDSFAEFAEIAAPETTNHTLGGWLIEEFQRIPKEGEEFVYEHLSLKIEKAEEKRVRQVLLKVNKKPHEVEEAAVI
ncbi:hemolysin family protein [Halalkalibacter krulwichiae]|uniref:Magnesium and cobalt efflux protein CorC n=1 Tax=Halalkalibacter krulwichiae TaxID=199441 RepID=A0A1X9MGR5_9BACI|nr:hemolysin family protein [Halalkalibacter krulwichiae]ARK32655.1 Magnesium and cobalt efflux protein CorC [Halalkalibacter krulwichiae]